MKRINKFLLIFFVGYFLIQLFLTQNYTLNSDEGTHTILAMFYKDILVNMKNFRSLNDVIGYATEYAIKYPKITPIYPPLYHALLTIVLLVKESIFLGRILNLSIIILVAFIIYELGLEMFNDEKIAFLSSVFFLTFNTIFRHASLLMMDMLQVLTFSLVLLYYLKLKNRRIIIWREIIILSFLLSIAFLTKFFSVFLVPIILIDSFFNKKKMFKHFLLSMILSLIVISPYIFVYVKFKIYKFFLKVATSTFNSKWIYFDFSSNFGIFIGWFVTLSTVWFLWNNRKNLFILTWFFLPLLVFMFFKDCDIRFAYILMPVYAISCGFVMKNIDRVRSKQKRNLITSFIFFLLILQISHNVYLNYHSFVYPVDDLMKLIEKQGNVLIMSEEPVYSSVYIFHARMNNIPGNILRPCILLKNDLTNELLEKWGIRYIVDQDNSIDGPTESSLTLTLMKRMKTENYDLKLFETTVEKKVDCNYICRLEGKVCKEDGFSGLVSLMSNISISTD